MDGIDAALIKSDGLDQLETGPNSFFAYKKETRDLLTEALEDAKAIGERSERPGVLKEAERAVTDLHISAVKEFLDENSLSRSEIDLIGFHGQTVLHRPGDAVTVQLGDGKRLAKETGIATVYDLRANDMENGGQGAPLIPIYHKALAAGLPQPFASQTPVVFVNIGGISNITYVDDDLVAFDTGPGNALIDQWVQKAIGIPFDQGGMIAAEGNVSLKVVERFLENDYFARPLPKSLDRLDFNLDSLQGIGTEDGARTLARITAAAILKSVDHLPKEPKLWIVCGGGRHNPLIMMDLRQLAQQQGSKAISAEDAGLNGDMMEAEGWAYLAIRSAEGLPLTYPNTTGVKSPVSGGVIAKP